MSETQLETLSIDADKATVWLEAALRGLKNFRGCAESARATGEVYVQEMGQALQQAVSSIGMAAPFLLALQAGLGNIVLEAQEEARGQVRDDAEAAN